MRGIEDAAGPALEGFTPWPADFAQRYRAEGYWVGETFGQMLTRLAERFGEQTALVGAGRRITYADLDRRATELARGFAALGVEARDRVVLQMPNAPEFVEVCFGLFRLGAVPVFALPAHRRAEIEAFCRVTEAVAYVTSDAASGYDYPALGHALKGEIPSLCHVIIVGEAAGHTPLAAVTGPPREMAGPRASDVAFLQLSGGSTAVPKLIPRTHDDYLYSVRRSVEVCRLDASCVYLCALPVAHNFPWSSPGVLGVLAAGGKVVFALRPSPDVAFPLIREERVTVTALVPPLLALWLEAAKNLPAPLESLKWVQVGGAKLGSELAGRVRSVLGATLQQVYGMAEGLVNYTRPEDSEELVLESQGRPMSPADELRVVDAEGNDVAPGAVGELWTRGPYTIRGYYKAPAENARSFSPDGYYRTGDLVRALPSGHLVVEGRIKDQINRGGDKVSAEEIENHLVCHPGVRDAIVVAAPDRFLGEHACAFVIPADPALTTKDLLDFMRGRGLATYKVPDRVRFVAAFPETGVGKVHRGALREALKASLASAPERPAR